MATYIELYNLRNNSELRNRVTVACTVVAEAIRVEVGTTENHANRLIWSKAVFENPERESERMYWALLASCTALTVAQITGATDAVIQTKVDAAVNEFATG